MRVVYFAAVLSVAAVFVLCLSSGDSEPASLSQLQRHMNMLHRASVQERKQMLFGGDGLITTGDYVDGRPTTPGLQTDCIPGVLRSDCSPAQEDGAWSKEAAEYIVRSLRPDG
jgi:hypothetical protein